MDLLPPSGKNCNNMEYLINEMKSLTTQEAIRNYEKPDIQPNTEKQIEEDPNKLQQITSMDCCLTARMSSVKVNDDDENQQESDNIVELEESKQKAIENLRGSLVRIVYVKRSSL